MKFRAILIISLIFVLLMFVNVISATELDNISLENNYEGDLNYNYELNHETNLLENNMGFNDSIEIYIGQNTTNDGGNGSYDNPYNSFNLAYNYVNTINKSQVTINVFDGVYWKVF